MTNDKSIKTNKRTTQMIQHPLFGVSVKNWITIVENNKGLDAHFLPRAVFITVMSLCLIPVRFLFKIRYNSKINKTELTYPPVFIIGHWRSGTTFLHELLSKDPQFCHVSLWNTLLPDSFLVLEPIKKFLSKFLPTKRPMDDIAVEIDGPYEDEAALAVLCPWSFFHCLYFPRNAEEQYLKSIHFQGLSSEEIGQWKQTYQRFIKTVSYANQGKRLLSKNPPHTARIAVLRELFPNACFIHIYRSPYSVYLSTKKMRRNVLDILALQHHSEEDIEQQVIANYVRLMNSYFEQKENIPKDKLIEIRYEDLIADPMKHVKKIYTTLKLPGFETAKPEIEKHLAQQAEYKTNKYSIDKKIIQQVNESWMFTVDRWKYSPPK
jgi:omega-hydroxy-beta-dihydromenaquinone-9 sulfotransferase